MHIFKYQWKRCLAYSNIKTLYKNIYIRYINIYNYYDKSSKEPPDKIITLKGIIITYIVRDTLYDRLSNASDD